jgi:hypothetical protein
MRPCLLCPKPLDPGKEGAPAWADVKAHLVCAKVLLRPLRVR